MPSVGMNTDISSLIDATVSGNTDQIIAVARELTQRGANPSELIGRVGMLAAHGDSDGQTINSAMHDAVFSNDRTMVERLILGLYGTGADYRTMQIRVYDSISTTFQHAGHPLMFAVRGLQLLDAVEWGDRAPNIIHWLAPHLPLHTEEPPWVNPVRSFLSEPSHSLASYRTRLAAPQEENALPLRRLILSNADTLQICQGVYDALIKNGAS